MAVCKTNKLDGQPCEARAVHGSDLCYFHAPEMRGRRQNSQRRGGSKKAPVRVMSNPPAEFDLSISSNVTKLLNYAVNRLVRGELDVNSAYAIVSLSDCANRVRNTSLLIQRLDELERLQQAEACKPLDQSVFRTRFIDSDDPADCSMTPEAQPATAQAEACKPLDESAYGIGFIDSDDPADGSITPEAQPATARD